MNLTAYIFYFFVLTALLSAIAILMSKNVFKASLFLLCCLLSLASLYIFALAEFIAVAQIVIYAGGVLLLIIFGIMLTSKYAGKPLRVDNKNLFSGLLVGVGLLALLLNFIEQDLTMFSRPLGPPVDYGIEEIGINFITAFALPFEVAGILLLVALVGAAVITAFMKSKKT